MLIRLTRWKKYIDLDNTVYLNPLTITAMWADRSCTRVNTIDGGWDVAESPEEIIKAIEGKVIIHARETECEEVTD